MKFALNEISLINRHLAEWTGLALSTIDRAAQQGRLQTHYIGTNGETRVVRIADVISWKENEYAPKHGSNRSASQKATKPTRKSKGTK